MQTTERLMTYDDILALANQLAQKIIEPVLSEINQKLQNIEDANAKKDDDERIFLTAKDIAKEFEISLKRARKFINMPNFPTSIGGKRKLYKTGPWSAKEVKRFILINKSKV